jgi:hypothetical protein
LEGVIKIEEVLNYIERVIKDKTIKSGFIEIVNFEKVEDLVLSFDQMSPFSEIWEKYHKKGCKALLMFSPKNLDYGISRMVQAIVEPPADVNLPSFEVFRTMEELEIRLAELTQSQR